MLVSREREVSLECFLLFLVFYEKNIQIVEISQLCALFYSNMYVCMYVCVCEANCKYINKYKEWSDFNLFMSSKFCNNYANRTC